MGYAEAQEQAHEEQAQERQHAEPRTRIDLDPAAHTVYVHRCGSISALM